MSKQLWNRWLVVIFGVACFSFAILCDDSGASAQPGVVAAEPGGIDLSKMLAWRSIGPANMGGRVTGLAVFEADPSTYYVATASGGLLKTVNNGSTFEHQFDKEKTVSIGAVAVAPTNRNIVWVGTGEANPATPYPMATAFISPPTAANRGRTRGSPRAFKSAASSFIRRTPTSFTLARSADSMARTKNAVCSRPAMAARRGTRFITSTTRPASWMSL